MHLDKKGGILINELIVRGSGLNEKTLNCWLTGEKDGWGLSELVAGNDSVYTTQLTLLKIDTLACWI